MRDYQAEIDAARDEAVREESRKPARVAEIMDFWNSKWAPAGMAMMRYDEWKWRAFHLGRELRSLDGPAPKPHVERGVQWWKRDGDRVEMRIDFGLRNSPDAAMDNKVRLFVAQRTGLIIKLPLRNHLTWECDYEFWSADMRIGTDAVGAEGIVVHREWLDWPWPPMPDGVEVVLGCR